MADRVVDGIMKSRPKTHPPSAIGIIEEAVHLLRSAPGNLLAGYYLGSAPFVLALMYFWADMSRSAKAADHSAMAALGLAFLFVWMKFWQTVFAHRLKAQIGGELKTRWPWGRIVSVTATQSLIQSTRFIVLPIAGVMMIPFGFCYAFYQNAAVQADEDPQTVKSIVQWALRQSLLWPRQNHLLIAICWIFGGVIFLNLSLTVFIIPQMAKTLLGIDSIFTLSGIRMILNTTFWVAILGMTYLCLDPLVKTVYVLRCFYGSSLESGEDLKQELNHLMSRGKKIALGLAVVVLCTAPFTCLAGPPTPISPGELDRSIEETLERREFSWRMPREKLQDGEPAAKGPLEAGIKWMLDVLAKGIRFLGKLISQFIEWLESLLPQPDKKLTATKKDWITPVRAILIILVILLTAMLTFVLFRIWRRHRSAGTVEATAAGVKSLPDLNDEDTKADDLPANRWLVLAEEFTAKGELRLAIRALYLATLAYLAEHDMITIEIYKSNREYERELRRRAHDRQELIDIFNKSLNLFERAWYGMCRIPRSDFDEFATNQKRILAFAPD